MSFRKRNLNPVFQTDWKGLEKVCHAQNRQKEAQVAGVMPAKGDFQTEGLLATLVCCGAAGLPPATCGSAGW